MCVVAVHFQENLPSESEQFKTRHFAVDLKENIPDNSNLNEAISRLFVVAQSNVQFQIQQAQIQQPITDGAYTPQQRVGQQPLPHQQSNQNNGSNGKSASEKQIKYIKTLAGKKGYSPQAINTLPHDYFQKEYYQLSSREASTIIENLSAKGS